MYTLKKQADGLLWLFVGDQVRGTLSWRNEDETEAEFLEDSAIAFPRSEISNVDEFPQLAGQQWFACG